MTIAVGVVVVYGTLNLNDSRQAIHLEPELRTGGFAPEIDGESRSAFRRLQKRRAGRKSQSERDLRLPDPGSLESGSALAEPLYANVSLAEIPNLWAEFEAQPLGWDFLTKRIRSEIAAGATARDWDGIVLHQSSSPGGNAAMLDHYHRTVRGVEDGLAYHFVIGNGVYAGDGEIEVGERWVRQLRAGQLPGDQTETNGISICLVGNFSAHPPTAGQLRAMKELVTYLHARIGRQVEVATHRRSGDGSGSCPGRYFPRDLALTSSP